MNPRKRSSDRKNWPDNLHGEKRKGGQIYYTYYRPDLPKGHPDKRVTLGYIPNEEAVQAAIQANQHFANNQKLIERVTGQISHRRGNKTIGEFITEFKTKTLRERRINGQPLSERTLSEYDRLYNNINKEIGGNYFDTINQEQLKALLNTLGTTAEVYNKYRTRLIDLYRHAIDAGLTPDNLPNNILTKDKSVKKRKRITLPGNRPGEHGIDPKVAYDAIFDHASPAIQRAMELAVNFLQRREEIQKWRRDWKNEDGYIYIRISKTHKHGKSSFIRINQNTPTVYSRLGANTLDELIEKCLKSTLCPYLVYEKPKRSRVSKEKKHAWQLSPKQISDGFSEARDKSGLYDHLKKEEKPTFHELISLGQFMRLAQGWSEDQIKTLRGHSKLGTTMIYFEGHEWTTVENPGGNKL